MVGEGAEAYPSWVELAGADSRFVGRFGSARPVSTLDIDENRVRWQLPRQYESRHDDLVFEGRILDGSLSGTTTLEDGSPANWRGVRAPDLTKEPKDWGPSRSLIESDLSNWSPRSPAWQNNWRIVDGILVNLGVGTDLVSNETFGDFKLIAEYKYPPGSNSGIYLRGRYEVQIVDDYGHGTAVGSSGAVYGFIEPSTNAVKPPDEWNLAEITLIGRWVSIVLNGQTVIESKEIPGITGGALDSDEGSPGPFFLQGDHGPVSFRRLDIASQA
jgi:hypothetical protein